MEKIFVAQRVSKKLGTTEAAIDAAMTEVSELLADVLKAPRDAGVSPTLADPVQTKLMETLKLLSEARTSMVGAHSELHKAKLRVGIRTKLIYDFGDKLADTSETTASLRDVG